MRNRLLPRCLFLLLLLGALLSVPSGAMEPRQPSGVPTTYRNPVLALNRADPCVLYDNRMYWMTHTAGNTPGWPLWTSNDLVEWRFLKSLLTEENKPKWVTNDANKSLWAPEIHRVGRSYVLTFTARDPDRRLCIGIATAPAITGPYTAQEAPLIREKQMGMIDSHLFQDDDGKKYLLWKDDANDLKPPQPCHLFIREMDDTCTGWAPGSSPQILLTSNAEGWEGNLIEAPWMLKRGSTYYLFYSGNRFGGGYAVGVARSGEPTRGFTRFSGNPILRTNDTWKNPGHGAFVRDVEGTDWHLYHAYYQQPPDPKQKDWRVQLLDRLYWEREPGWPLFGNNGTPSITDQWRPAVNRE
jgi:beta-xylosidase